MYSPLLLRGHDKIDHLIKFFEVILGTLMAAPSKLLPVTKMPLEHT